ncbi:MAG: molecular chaperone DnaJ [Cyanobacteria bacterium QH_8_48_120]|jgi:molecular chaperone DnaJ|nr:MAG: molecular chaperone DnaJ [Cyanobacteria bacterium QH_1_48_107]PSO56193.1 MAG: molecular chaperone DnaJ [Cyanobacteria bacterium QH_10_48_56]PSO59206.1 MAG: molecular chaperone DnaJ [Cyanobacteria bacterium QH_7_48_89]PSO63238.1 MAG: molecular chaperone DnaJ [Cyanobacteria bacterium QH_6_48_35]PSO68350.1 MAG: molecular chaperone DnaJ [Cyanobacteria bacterium QS_1_48_34]PSO74386.1 MAG: molecular chaperone DnaJ [Cyanobacteria bacterium QH_8_48_120]PSO77111.1 MAG: molecular chaperone DnaJ
MPDANHYETLGVDSQATQAEIKQAYRHLVKRFHPDSNSETANHDKIVSLNAAYEVLSSPQRRRFYDQRLFYGNSHNSSVGRQQRTADAQNFYKSQRQTGREADDQLHCWLREVYLPVNRLVGRIINPLDKELDHLSADPFDDQLMEAFENYLQQCRDCLDQAQRTLASQPNPANVAGTAANLYYCLNQIGDGIEELERFTFNYNEHYLHAGKELFRIATGLRYEAQDAAQTVA